MYKKRYMTTYGTYLHLTVKILAYSVYSNITKNTIMHCCIGSVENVTRLV